MCFIFYLIICQPTLIYTFFPIRLSILRAQERSQGHVWKCPVTTHRYSQLYPTLCDSMDCSFRFLCPWDYPGKNTGVGCHAIPGDLLNPGIKPRSFALQAGSLPSEPPVRILEWVAYPSSRESSWPRNWTRVSCIAGRFFTCWTTREDNIELSKVVVFFSGCG